jgi:hypothetical protein
MRHAIGWVIVALGVLVVLFSGGASRDTGQPVVGFVFSGIFIVFLGLWVLDIFKFSTVLVATY